MISFRVPRIASLAAVVGLLAGPVAADDAPRGDGKPATILVPAPEAGSDYKVVPPGGPGDPPPGLYKRVTPLREGEQARPEFLPAVPSRPAEGKRDEDEGLERARAAARAAKPERPADPPSGSGCLSSKDARDAIRAKRAVTLVAAARTARDAWDGEVIDYKLCNVEGLLTYDLTLLNSDGKVARARIDAGTGKLVTVK